MPLVISCGKFEEHLKNIAKEKMNVPLMKAAPHPVGQLPDMPLDPATILAGRPAARGIVLLENHSGNIASGIWTCEPGEFRLTFTGDEFMHVLDGEVTITDESGHSLTLRRGDSAHFPHGLKSKWVVTQTLRDFFVLCRPSTQTGG
jgi:uncharacterized cupin superfamily protein